MKRSPVPVENGFRVRLMSPLGSYPADSFIAESASLVVATEICFSAARVKSEDWRFSEVDNLHAIEIPLLGSIILSGGGGERYIYPYPTHNILTLESAADEALTENASSECKALLLDNLKKSLESWPADISHRPPALGGTPYTLIPSRHDDEERLVILRRLEAANPVVLRGVDALVKAHMAWNHAELGEAACIFLWIALDAAFSLTLEKLRKKGVTNPTSKDAAKYVEQISGYNLVWEKFFEHDYKNRIRALHPDNRFGAEARPQFDADDFAELNDMLIPMFQYIVLYY
jgi:hypothetical protein